MNTNYTHPTINDVSIDTVIELAVTRQQNRIAIVGANHGQRRQALAAIHDRIDEAHVFANPLQMLLTAGAERIVLPNGGVVSFHSTSRSALRGSLYELVAFDMPRSDVPERLVEDGQLATLTTGGAVGFLTWTP
ncbi:hypothetical protein [Curtobacterium oceanosedimentum]|uniref:hypothetical protein n=1 Tax=Curtobacterium oceanosedimentum TaxID=465820 RepID=UPI00339AA5E4